MARKDNSVNIKNYHHGDLRSALVAEGLKLLAESDAEHLSLREIARNVGVSATAVYRHFPDKQALLSALAQAGGKQMGQLQAEAGKNAGGGVVGFNEIGRAYVRFAIANPALFRLMTSSARNYAPLDAGSDAKHGLDLLLRNVDALSPPGTSPQSKRARAIQAWSFVHGLAMLILDGQVPPDHALIDEVIESGAIWQASR